MNGHPKTILALATDETNRQTLEPNYEVLNSILHHEKCKDKRVSSVISIIGAARKGKSVMMNWMLQYLQSARSDDWLQDVDESNGGFPWRGGSESVTSGILMWSEPFVVVQDDREVAILLMDTQGLFDGQLSNDMRARLFVISTLMSSVQIFNAKSDIQDDTLQYLKTFTDYGAVRGSEAGHQFQKLVFLIRDTEFGDYDLGQEGGLEFLKWKLGQDGGGDDVVHVRRNLAKTFKDVECFLLPHPGPHLALSRDQLCPLHQIDPTFKQHMKAFVEKTLATDTLAIKRVEGHNMTGVELSDYVRKYVDKITANISFSESILHANQMASSLTALDRAYERFNGEMLAIFGDNEPGVSDEQFDKYVSQCTNLAYVVYNETALNHRHESYETTRENLAEKIRSRTRKFKLLNDAKNNKFKAAYEILLTILKLIKLYAFRLRGVAAFAVGLAAFVIPLVMASMATGTTLASIAAFLAPLVSSVSLRPFIWPQLVALFVALMRMYDE